MKDLGTGGNHCKDPGGGGGAPVCDTGGGGN
jgi:hypothetical protein